MGWQRRSTIRRNAAAPRDGRNELLEFAHAALSIRWLVLAALLLYEVFTPAPVPTPTWLYVFYVGMLIYTLGLTLYAWRFPQLAHRAARVGVLLDTLTIGIGMRIAGHAQPFFYYGFVTAVVAGLLLAHWGAAVIAGIIGVLQSPPFHGSLFAPGMYAAWAFAALAMLGAGQAAAVAAVRLQRHTDITGLLTSLGRLSESTSTAAETVEQALAQIVHFMRAESGSVMLFDPQDERLEILAAHGLIDAAQQTRVRLGEGIAGWVAQEGRPILLTPEVTAPAPLLRHEIGSSMCIPVSSAGDPLGVLNINRATTRPYFTQDDLLLGELAARHVATMLIRAQHERAITALLAHVTSGFMGVSRALLRDPAVLWPVLLDQTRSVTGAQFAVLALEREDTGTLDVVASRGIGGQAALTFLPGLLAASTDGRPHMAGAHNSGDGAQTVACVPLHLEQRRIGAIALGVSNGTPLNARQLDAMAAFVAAAVHTARTASRVADIGVVEERRRIAREMHDGLAQTLADALLQTDLSVMAMQGGSAQVASDLKDLRALLERGMRELREFMSELRREPEAREEFAAALEELGRDFQRRDEISTSVVVTGDASRVPSAAKYAMLAIVRQALTNVRAHANATTVTIRAEIADDACTTSVTDNGVGFDLAAFRARPPGPHLGLVSMEERAALVGGRLDIQTMPGHGTTVAVRVPLGKLP